MKQFSLGWKTGDGDEKGSFCICCCNVIKKVKIKENEIISLFLFISPRPPGKLCNGTAEDDRERDHEHASKKDRENPGVVRAVGLAPEMEFEFFFFFFFGA